MWLNKTEGRSMSELKQIGRVKGKDSASDSIVYLEKHANSNGKLYYGLVAAVAPDGVIKPCLMGDIIASFDLDAPLMDMVVTVDNPLDFIQSWRDVYNLEKVIKVYWRNNPRSLTLPLLQADLLEALDKIWSELTN
jgi:hypothetical protein